MGQMDDKFVRQSISFPPKLLSRVRANTDNLSAYVRALIEQDLENHSAESRALSATIIIDLARVLLGELDAQELETLLDDKVNQPKLLQGLLRAIADRAASGRLTQHDDLHSCFDEISAMMEREGQGSIGRLACEKWALRHPKEVRRMREEMMSYDVENSADFDH